MKIPFTQDFPIIVELIELRESSEETIFTKARRVYKEPGNTSCYEIQGVKRLIPAPHYKHLVLTPKGRLLRLYSPSPDEYYVVGFKRPAEEKEITLQKKEDGTLETKQEAADRLIKEGYMPAELSTKLEEDMKNWFTFEVDRAHAEYTKKLISDRLVIFIMLFIIAILMIAMTKIVTDGMKDISNTNAGIAGAALETQNKQIVIEEKFDKILERMGYLLDEKGVPSSSGGTGGTVVVQPPV